MSETSWEESGRGQEPGADVGDDGDIPANPLLGAAEPGEGTMPATAGAAGGGSGVGEAAVGGGTGDLGGGGAVADDMGTLDEDDGTA